MIKDSSNFWKKTFEAITSCKTKRKTIFEEDEYCEIKADIKDEFDTRSTLPKSDNEDNRKYNKNDEDNLVCEDAVSKIPLLNKKWTIEEDKILISLVKSNRKRDWKKIALALNKTSSQCSYRYSKIRNHIKKAKWNRKEDLKLLELVELYGKNWGYIQTKMNNKTIEDIRLHYTITLDSVKNKRSNSLKDSSSNNINSDDIMMIDNDIIPSNKHKLSIDTDNPIINQNFDDEYNNVFVKNNRKDSYEINFSDQFMINNENSDLLKQYQLLENVFEQVYEFSNKYQNTYINDSVDNNLENKRQLLSLKLNTLKEDYLNIINNNVNNAELVKKSLINQIEVLIELINTIKLRIAMIQNGKSL
jgi:hypothetical protein